jgi:hypothetical protein
MSAVHRLLQISDATQAHEAEGFRSETEARNSILPDFAVRLILNQWH